MLIDAVILWVNDNDNAWKISKTVEQELCKYPLDNESVADHRFKSHEDLLFCVSSIISNTSFIRKIFIVTCGQIPPFWTFHPNTKKALGGKLELVFHNQIMPAEHLPTFNSAAIEMNIHKIPNLANIFLYFNDDMFVFSPMNRHALISASKIKYYAGPRSPGPLTNNFEWQKYCNEKAIKKGFNYRVRDTPIHQALLLRRDVFHQVWTRCKEACLETSSSKFRTNVTSNIRNLNIYVFYHAAKVLGYAITPKTMIRHAFASRDTLDRNKRDLIRMIRPQLLCINDGLNPVIDDATMHTFLQKHIKIVQDQEELSVV